jgi:lipopolysaccharide/colanic/teichoic acid biosynthesis glycosyltransferase
MTDRRYDVPKRVIDVVVATAGLIVTAPIQLVVAILVRRKLGSPVLFQQLRPGRHGEPFTLVKFRTMLDVDEARGLVEDADRLTPFGAALRSTSLDELPTLWNVLKGDMSLVGPRPLLMQYADRYTVEQARRHEIRPGITGLAQISGRNLMGWDDRLAADVEYVDGRSLAVDLRILGQTLLLVARRHGISAQGEATMPELKAPCS